MIVKELLRKLLELPMDTEIVKPAPGGWLSESIERAEYIEFEDFYDKLGQPQKRGAVVLS